MTPALEGLRRATHDIHTRLHLHPAFAALTATPPHVAGYLRLLGQLHGFHAPVEAWLFAAAGRLVPELADLDTRRKAHLLTADIAAFAGHFPPVTRPVDTPALGPPPSRPEVLGCLYVIEGATLGGRELGRRLDPVLHPLGMPEPQGRQFLLAYGTRQGAMWRHFCAVLERAALPFSAAEHGAMQDAARQMFLVLEVWLTSSYPPRDVDVAV